MKRFLILVLLGVFLFSGISIVSADACSYSNTNYGGYNYKIWTNHVGSYGKCDDGGDNECWGTIPWPSGYDCTEDCHSSGYTYGPFTCNVKSGDYCYVAGCRKSLCSPTDGYCSSWSGYSQCLPACDGGTKTRTRTYTNPSCGGSHDSCKNTLSQTIACTTPACCTPVNAVCDTPVNVQCGVTQSRSGNECGSSCTVQGTKCDDPTLSCTPVGTCSKIGSAFWTDLDDNPIPSAHVGDTVKMIATGVNTSTYDVTFEIDIENEANNIWNKILSWLGISGSASQSITSETYTIVNNSDHSFTAIVPVLNVNGTSDWLSISTTTDTSGTLSLDLISPVCGDIFPDDPGLVVNVTVSDPDDLIQGNVTLNGGEVMNLVRGFNSISYTDLSPGEYVVKAEASNNRGQYNSSQTNIIISGGIGKFAAACIDYPIPGTFFSNKTIEFSAESTSGIVCNGTSCETLLLNDHRLQYNWTFPTNPNYNSVVLGNGSMDSIVNVPPFLFNATFDSSGIHPAKLDVRVI